MRALLNENGFVGDEMLIPDFFAGNARQMLLRRPLLSPRGICLANFSKTSAWSLPPSQGKAATSREWKRNRMEPAIIRVHMMIATTLRPILVVPHFARHLCRGLLHNHP